MRTIDDVVDHIFMLSQKNINQESVKASILNWHEVENINNNQTLHENLRQKIEEADAFRKSSEFWRSEFLKQQDSLKFFEPKQIQMKIIEEG